MDIYVSQGPKKCNVNGCTCAARVDVYFKDGSSKIMCGEHAWDLPRESVDAVIPWY